MYQESGQAHMVKSLLDMHLLFYGTNSKKVLLEMNQILRILRV